MKAADLICAMNAFNEDSYIGISEGETEEEGYIVADETTPERIVAERELISKLSKEAKEALLTIFSLTSINASIRWRNVSTVLRKEGIERKRRLQVKEEIKEVLRQIVSL